MKSWSTIDQYTDLDEVMEDLDLTMDDICGDKVTGPTGIEWICISTPDMEVLNIEGDHSHYYVRNHPKPEE